MASVKFYLDKRNKKKDGTYPLKLTVSHAQKPFHIPLDVSIPEENWINDKVEGEIPNKKFLNNYLRAQFSNAENIILRLKIEGRLERTTSDTLKKMIKMGEDFSQNTPEKPTLFSEHAKQFIASRQAKKTREIYQYTIDTISKHHDIEALTFAQIDYNFLVQLDIKLRPTCKVNTRSIHFRNIRAIYKNAMKTKVISKELYPFDDFSIKNEDTLHRDLSIEDLRILHNFQAEPHQEQYQDLFMLLFYLIGINTIDILHATAIKNGRLEFLRAKTGRLYSIKIQPEAMRIIQKYSPGKKYLLNFLDNYTDYENFRSRFNKNLKQIGPSEWIEKKTKTGRKVQKKVYYPLFPFLSSYYARHTWASIAAQLDIPEKTIKMALGHGAKSVTDTYINFDTKKIDAANRKVIDHLLNIPQSP